MEESTPKHILVVDDEDVILEVFRTLFAGDGYRMTFLRGGREAIDFLRRSKVDLVIADKNLLDISGLEVAKAAKEIDPLIEVIIITAFASLDTVLAAMELDVFDYMLKPLHNIFDIKKKVRQALEKREVTLENRRLLQHLQEHARKLEAALEERKRVESELIQSEKLAGIGTLAAGIAHEISSPLFGILGLAEAILDEEDIELTHQYAREIVDYSKQIKEIVQELSAYSRTARHESLVPVSIARIVEDAVRMVIRSKRTDPSWVQVEVPSDLSLVARPSEIQQIVVNLVKNAVEAVEACKDRNPLVRVSGMRDEGDIVLQVTDTGHGIAPEQVEQVFDPFFTTKEVGKGTGLGLHIVYRIVTKYGGTIHVDTEENRGTTFTLRFPAGDG